MTHKEVHFWFYLVKLTFLQIKKKAGSYSFLAKNPKIEFVMKENLSESTINYKYFQIQISFNVTTTSRCRCFARHEPWHKISCREICNGTLSHEMLRNVVQYHQKSCYEVLFTVSNDNFDLTIAIHNSRGNLE